ncbi:L-carnitine dehydratase/bile acid-inducible protein F [Novosphingobium resinovorum]|uniref:L-carnitine dehydratase/bile acid-inducible protein F n=1 Tax=Novosphingobium resinovorum TaxID=158500 RepID=A0A031K3C7_9SPHN|nr:MULTISPECIES: CoA transferase [Novosphingobium]EZP83107.1 L-carnitine dehydratase/bile acid-inducible protein F [Novosphingobium resinovorum]
MTGNRMLEGIRVIDMSGVVFGPYATFMLAELGAEVIKVEGPGGDQMRHLGKPARTKGMSPTFVTVNQGKKSVVLDLKSEGDREMMRDLLRTADIFIHNVRGDAIRRLKLDYENVKLLNPDLIYVHCVGFGSDGPYSGLPAYDDVIQAASGATSLSQRVSGGPPTYLPSLIGDKVSGLYAANAALAAVIHRLRTGEGQLVEVPMFEAFTQFMLLEHLGGKLFDPPNAPVCYARQVDPDRQPFPTANGFISIVPYVDAAWPKLFQLLGDAGILEFEEMTTASGRYKNIDRLYREVARLTPQKTTEEWMALLKAADIPAMIARDIDDILDDPHLSVTGYFQRLEHPSEGGYYATSRPVRYQAWPDRIRSPAPLLGEHNDEVLRDLSAAKQVSDAL